MSSSVRTVVVTALLVLSIAPVGYSQQAATSATVSGTVSDQTASVIVAQRMGRP